MLVGLILGTMVTFILEKKFLYAAIASAVGAVLSFIGLIHAPEVAWAANPQVALGYLFFGIVCVAVLVPAGRQGSGRASTSPTSSRATSRAGSRLAVSSGTPLGPPAEAAVTPGRDRCLRLPKFSWSVVHEVAYARADGQHAPTVSIPAPNGSAPELRDAAFALAHERPVDELTVGDIVARAGGQPAGLLPTLPRPRRRGRVRLHRRLRVRRPPTSTATPGPHPALCSTSPPNTVRCTATSCRARSPSVWSPRSAPNSLPACERDRRRRACRPSPPIASLTPESVSRFLVGGFMEVLRSWMEDPDATDLRGRVTAALDTVDALLGLSAAATITEQFDVPRRVFPWHDMLPRA